MWLQLNGKGGAEGVDRVTALLSRASPQAQVGVSLSPWLLCRQCSSLLYEVLTSQFQEPGAPGKENSLQIIV